MVSIAYDLVSSSTSALRDTNKSPKSVSNKSYLDMLLIWVMCVTGSSSTAQQRAANSEKDFLPPHLKGMVSPSATAPAPVLSRPQQLSSAAIATSKASEKPAQQPQKLQSPAGLQEKAPASAPKAPNVAKRAPSLPAKAAAQQPSAQNANAASARHANAIKALPAPKAASASTPDRQASTLGHISRAAASAKQAAQAAGRAAATHHEAPRKGQSTSAGAAPSQRTPPASADARPASPVSGGASHAITGTPLPAAARKVNEGRSPLPSTPASDAPAASTALAASKSQSVPLPGSAAAPQKPAVRPAAAVASSGASAQTAAQKQASEQRVAESSVPVQQAATTSLPPKTALPSVAMAPAMQPVTSTAVSAKAIAAANLFLSNLGIANSSASDGSADGMRKRSRNTAEKRDKKVAQAQAEASWSAPLFPSPGHVPGSLPFPPGMIANFGALGSFSANQPAVGQVGSFGSSQPAAEQLGSKYRPVLPKQLHPPSPELRLESLMQELSGMGHKLANAAPAHPQPSLAPAATGQPQAAHTASRPAATSAVSLQQPPSRSASPANDLIPRGSAPVRPPQPSISAEALRNAAKTAIAKQVKPITRLDTEEAAAEKLRKQIAELQRTIELKELEGRRKAAAARTASQRHKLPESAPEAAPATVQPSSAPAAKATREARGLAEQPLKPPSAVTASSNHITSAPAASAPGPTRHPVQQSAPAEGQHVAQQGSRSVITASRNGQASSVPASPPAVAPQKHQSSAAVALGFCSGHSHALSARKAPGGEGIPATQGTNLPALGSASSNSAPIAVPEVRSSQPLAAQKVDQAAGSQPDRAPQQASEAQQVAITSVPQSLASAQLISAKPASVKAAAQPPQEGHKGPSEQPLVVSLPASPAATPASGAGETVQRAVHKDRVAPTLVPVSSAVPSAVMPSSAARAGAHLAAQEDMTTPAKEPQPDAAPASLNGAVPSRVEPAVTPVSDESPEQAAAATPAWQPAQAKGGGGAEGRKAAPARATPAVSAFGSLHFGTPEPSPQSGTKQAVLDKPLRREAQPAATATLQAGEDALKPAPTAKQGSALGTGQLPALASPVLAIKDSSAASQSPSSDTPSYIMLTQTPLGAGSAWAPAAHKKLNSPPAPPSGA